MGYPSGAAQRRQEITGMPGRSKKRLRPGTATARTICGKPDPLALVAEDYALQLELCDLPESLADDLPDCNRAIARSAAATLRQGFKPHPQLEEEMLFPLLRRRAPHGSPLEPIMQQLEAEHAADDSFAHELADELQLLADTGLVRNAEMLGYMLRAFFEHQRRHIEWENRVLLPLARQTLTRADLAELQDWIMSSARPACVEHSVATLKRMPSGPATCRQCASRARSAN
jgi:hemerythrin HHE cation binding domain-containing protein